MSFIQNEIEIHENNIKELYDKLKEELDTKDKLYINEKINSEQQFIISLLKIEDGEKKKRNKTKDDKSLSNKDKNINKDKKNKSSRQQNKLIKIL